ncbi:MAG TPA: hypothetical protein VFX07_04280 [Candidatus Udaeobacter sp.]|jgi:hypothetical protein|nr:hypothetical protein [Candidatus Udaeobacter sp.]
MTPQSNFMVLAPIIPEREAELRELLDSMNRGPGQVDPNNSLLPFAEFETLHFARFVILDDKTTEDVRVYGLAPRSYPLYLAFLGDFDGDVNGFLGKLIKRAGKGLGKIFSCCQGFLPDTDLLDWMKQHEAPAIAVYVNWRGRTVRQIREEAALYDALLSHIQKQAASLEGLEPQELHAKLRAFVNAEQSAGRLKLSKEGPTPIGWQIRNLAHMIGFPLAGLLLSPLLLVIAPFYIIALRRLEKGDPVVCPVADQKHSENLSSFEDYDVTNQFSAMGSLKPGLVRLLTTTLVLKTVNYGARHITRPGRLGRIRSIHFARWVFVAGRERMIFCSNYDGSVESYMDDFINKTGFGLNASFSNGIGYPRTNWLVRDGCLDERNYKEYLRRHTLPSQVWYKAYPGLSAVDLERNTRIRRGLEMSSMTNEQAREWVALL